MAGELEQNVGATQLKKILRPGTAECVVEPLLVRPQGIPSISNDPTPKARASTSRIPRELGLRRLHTWNRRPHRTAGAAGALSVAGSYIRGRAGGFSDQHQAALAKRFAGRKICSAENASIVFISSVTARVDRPPRHPLGIGESLDVANAVASLLETLPAGSRGRFQLLMADIWRNSRDSYGT